MEIPINPVKSPPLLLFVHPEVGSCSNKFAGCRIARFSKLSTVWRRNGYPVGHILPKLENEYRGMIFLKKKWEFIPGDLIFKFYGLSAYECPHFSILMQECHPDFCVIGGYSLDERILLTTLNGFMRSDRFFVLLDAVICEKSTEDCSHKYILYMLKKISEHAEIVSTDMIANFIKQSAENRYFTTKGLVHIYHLRNVNTHFIYVEAEEMRG